MEHRHQNSFGLMRWIFALAVVYSHSFSLTNHAGRGDLVARYTGHGVHELGVLGFFILSGFLNAGSLQRTPTPAGTVAFLIRRGFRILPLLWAMLVVAVAASWMVAGLKPQVLTSGLSFLFGNGLLYLPHWSLPGLFEHNPTPAVCGSLWTLPFEVLFYLIMASTGLGQSRGSDWAVRATLAAMLCITCLAMSPTAPPFFGGITPYYTGLLGWSFLCGIAIRKFPATLTSNRSVTVSVIFLAASIFVPAGQVAGWMALQVLAFAIIVMRLGSKHWGLPARFADRWDASYGIYLLSFPIQQILVTQGLLEPYRMFFASAGLSILAGLASWHFLERPMLERGKSLSRTYLDRDPAQARLKDGSSSHHQTPLVAKHGFDEATRTPPT